jgi:hypothetical protein
MSANGNLTVNGDVFVAAIETGSENTSEANATLTMTAGTSEPGSLTVTGNTGVFAIARSDYRNDAEADAWAQLRAQTHVTLGATADTNYTVPGLGAGMVGDNGAGIVTMTNLLEEAGLPTTTPPGLLPVNAPSVEVAALASSPEQTEFHGAKAISWLEITSGFDGGAGGINITGATDVRARATVLSNTGEFPGVDTNATGNEGLGNAKAKATAVLTARMTAASRQATSMCSPMRWCASKAPSTSCSKAKRPSSTSRCSAPPTIGGSMGRRPRRCSRSRPTAAKAASRPGICPPPRRRGCR